VTGHNPFKDMIDTRPGYTCMGRRLQFSGISLSRQVVNGVVFWSNCL